MTVDIAEVASRFLHYTAVTVLFGALCFFFRELPVEHSAEASKLPTPFRTWPIAMVLLAIASGLAWFAFTTAQMSQSLAAAIDPEALSAVLHETDFGPLWASRMILAVLVFAVLIGRNAHPGRSVSALGIGLSAVLLASLALTGHARSEEGGIGAVHVIADGLHLLAAGLWLGGLFGLSLLLIRTCSGNEEEAAVEALRRFSGTGFLAVAILIVTGVVNATLLVGSPEAMISTTYGRLLLCKLALFGAMLALAAANRFNLVPRLGQAKPMRTRVLATLQRHVLIEQIAGLAVLVIVSVLGTSAPPV